MNDSTPFIRGGGGGDVDIRNEEGQTSKLKPVKCFGTSLDN